MHQAHPIIKSTWTMTMQAAIKLLVSIIGVLAFASNALAVLPAGISANVVPKKASYSEIDAILVDVSYTNETTVAIKVLRWDTALEGAINDDFLVIRYAGAELSYTGRKFKRGSPSTADYTIIQPGNTKTITVDVSDGYSIHAQGVYTLAYRESRGVNLESDTQQFKVLQDRAVVVFKQPAIFNSCSTSQQSQINQALSVAESVSRTARDDLLLTPISKRSVASRYVKWFGSYTLNRWNTVQNHFNNIYQATASRNIGFDCDCPPQYANSFAFVNPSNHYNMTLCNAFWNANVSGTDSRAGTMVHELSHFNVVAATEDFAYGQQAASNLAISNPNSAVFNADSHEYFAENTPFLSMPEPVFPDLVIVSSTVSELNPSAGQAVLISGTLANQGDGAASMTQLTLSLKIISNNPIIITKAIPALAAGASFNFQFDFDAPDEPGEYAVALCISAVSDESNTTNNCSTLPQLMVKKPSVMMPLLLLLLDE